MDRPPSKSGDRAAGTLSFDHAIIAVYDLETAREDYERLGFTVISGGVHSSGLTCNALITFADGSYLELMAPTDPKLLKDPPKPGPGNYLFLFEAGEGFAGYSFVTHDLDDTVRRVRSQGLVIGDPQRGGRRRSDGVDLAWSTAMLPDTASPFFISDHTPRNLRVRDEPEITSHANGALGTVGIVVLAERLERAVHRYEALLNTKPEPSARLDSDTAASFRVSEFQVTLVAPEPSASTLREQLTRRGEVPYEIRLRTASPGQVGSMCSHGANIELVQV